MLSRPIAFLLVAVACVVAAGGGAYIATIQHARHDAAMAASQDHPTSTGAAPLPSSQAPVEAAPPAQQQSPTKPPVVQPPQPSPETSAPRPATRPTGRASAAQPQSSFRVAPPASTAPAARPTADQAGVPAPQIPPPSVEPAPSASPDTAPREEPKAEPQKAWEELTVPSDSVLGLQLESSLNSETARVEDRVDARVTRDVRVDGRVAIPAGTHAIGSVVLVERGGKIKDRSRLGVQFNTLVLPDSTRLKISTDTVYRDGESPASKSSAKIGGAAIGGAIIGSILGGGKGAMIGSGIGAAGGTAAAMAGNRQSVVLPVGTPLSVRVQSPVTVTIEK